MPTQAFPALRFNIEMHSKNMIEDCEGGKIDLIITKSVSRFARTVVDCIRYVRELSSLRPPVGVFLKQSI